MDALTDATDSQMAALAGLVDSLAAAEATLNAMMAARDGLLAIAGDIAVTIARQGDHQDKGDMNLRAVAAEIGQRLRLSDRTIERRIAEASVLVQANPAVWTAQGAGRISAAHSHVIIEAGAHLADPALHDAYLEAVLPLAEVESPNRLRALAKRIAERFQETSIDERHRRAREHRRVWMRDGDDAMAELTLHGPAVIVHAMMDRLSQMAHRIRTENLREAREARSAGVDIEPDARCVDEIRADLLADLVLTGAPTGHDSADGQLAEIRGRVEVTVPVTTLMSADLPSSSIAYPPALLDGTIPIDAETARMLAGAVTGWDRVLTHPLSGVVLAADRYRPPEQLRRRLRARDQRCRFPTCGLVARRCDLDHNHDAATGGATREDNLSAFCRRHHTLKHASPWHAQQKPGGVLEWTSPTGRTYIDEPPPQNTVVFTPSHPPSFTSFEDFADSVRAPF
ncbi:DUF222 domain-containing protein [Microbacterium sp.]|uniref:HNH endonuclease signature motif containing protein n=1 Tax=Microbacterium sp. TaxID=51671 RepID=UPI0039E2EA5F